MPPARGIQKEALWAVMKELAAVSRAQARVTQRLIELMEIRPVVDQAEGVEPHFEAGKIPKEETRRKEAPEGAPRNAARPSDTEEAAAGMPRPDGDPAAEALPVGSTVVDLDEVIVEREEPVAGISGGTPVGLVSPRAGGADGPGGAHAGATSDEGRDVAANAAARAVAEESYGDRLGGEPAPSGRADAFDANAEAPEEMEESEGGDEAGRNQMVLTLESGNAPVGVLWDQIFQIGPLTTSTVPDKLIVDRDEIRLISLGKLLHGVSKEEKYFVVLEQDGERVGVACERMIELGPLSGIEKMEKGPRIEVLKVPFLLTFAAKGSEEKTDIPLTTQTPEEQDRQGPLRALVAVRYLPARVAICRHLRGRGWQVGEAAGLEEATVSLDLGRWDALFLEARSNGEADEVESTLLHRVLERRVTVIRVSSRLTGYPGHEGSGLMYPFSEAELDAILVRAGRRPLT